MPCLARATHFARHLIVLFALLLGSPEPGFAQTYSTILDSGEDQTPQGVRGAGGSNVLLACSYTPEGATAPQGMWWLGNLATNTGTAYQFNPVIGSQVVTSALYYGPDTAEFNPSLGAGNIRIVGSYQYTGSTQDNNGVLYTGPLGGGGAWTQINVPDAPTGGTVANTIPHSVMGSIAVGNYNLLVEGEAVLGNAFLYNIATQAWTIFDEPFGGTAKLTSAYGIWQNGIGSTSYTIAGGSAGSAGGAVKAFLIDYDSLSGEFTNLTYFADGAPVGLTHFEGITGTPTGYNVIGIADAGYAFGSIARLENGTFGPVDWTGPLSYPGASTTTGNTVIGDQAIGIYQLPGDSAVYAYVATVPEPTALLPVVAALACGWCFVRRRFSGPVR